MTPIFREAQKFTQLWIWLAVAGVPLTVVLAMLANGKALLPDVLPVAILGVLLSLLFSFLRLDVIIEPDGLHVRFRPFVRRLIRFEEIESCEARTYRPIMEYGGWGIRYSFRRGKAYNVKGNCGVQLVLRSGEKILIGSQRADELAAALADGRSIGARIE